MKLSLRATAMTTGLLWAAGMLLVGIVNLETGGYGGEFLRMMSSIYPGFHASHTWLSVMVGTLYGFADGAVGGLVFAWLYDRLAAPASTSSHIEHHA